MAEAWQLAKKNIDKAQEVQKRKYDAKRAAVDLKVGERVMVYVYARSEQETDPPLPWTISCFSSHTY